MNDGMKIVNTQLYVMQIICTKSQRNPVFEELGGDKWADR